MDVTADDLALLSEYADRACFSVSSLTPPRMNARGGEALRRLLDSRAALSAALTAAWVPVAEREPEASGEYLTWSAEFGSAVGWWAGAWSLQRSDIDEYVTHWMALPAAPKE